MTPVYDFYCKICQATESGFQKISEYRRPDCPFGHGEMEPDMSMRGESAMAGYLQEKGKFPWYDIQTDTTYNSRKEWRDDMRRRGLRTLEKDEMTDRNRELFRHRKMY